MGRRTLRHCFALVAAVVALLALAGAAYAENYVAMGDSYSAGNGVNSTNLDSSCHRNTYAYPYLLAQQRGSALTFVACSGAKTGDIVNTQAARATASTNLVTLTIGGNDVGFTNLIIACTTLGCQSQINSSNSQITNQLPAKLDAAYNAIRSHAPSARVVVAGYGRPFAHRTCLSATGISLNEEDQLDALTDHLDSVIQTRALAHGFAYADPNPYWSGHDVCSSSAFTNGLTLTHTSDSYHPTKAGYANGDVPAIRAIIG
jgi:lysophospholipase L1-like esterase